MIKFLRPSFLKVTVSLFITFWYLYPVLSQTVLGCESEGFGMKCKDDTLTPILNIGLLIWFFSSFLMFPLTMLLRISALVLPSLNQPMAGHPLVLFMMSILVFVFSYIYVSLIAFLFEMRKKQNLTK